MNKIVKSHRGIYYVEKDGEIILCKARGLFRNEDIKPIVGDNVDISINDDGTGYIEKVYERKNRLLRPPLANIDEVAVVMSIVSPNINLNLLDKYLLMLEMSKVKIKIIFNKVDLVKDDDLKYIINIYNKAGYEIFLNSNLDKENIKELENTFIDKITALAGPSGVGKSTTLNKVFKDFEFDTGEISEKTQRGKHTTRHVEMSKIDDNSYVIDTPGFSSLSLDFIDDKSDIKNNFKEFSKYAVNCKFHNCYHVNEPKCGVKQAVEKGDIAKERYENYKIILEEYINQRRF